MAIALVFSCLDLYSLKQMQTLLWSLVLIASVWAAHWGSDRLAEPLEKLRRQWGLSEAAGAAFSTGYGKP